MTNLQAAPCRCIPDCLMAVVAEVAAARGDSFDETISSLIYCGLIEQNDGSDPVLAEVDFIMLAQEIDKACGVTA